MHFAARTPTDVQTIMEDDWLCLDHMTDAFDLLTPPQESVRGLSKAMQDLFAVFMFQRRGE